MLTFRDIQDAVLERFNEQRRSAAKEWINFVYGGIWGLEEWTFKNTTANVTVTQGSQTVSNLPADLGIPHGLLNSDGTPLRYLDWREWNVWHYGETTSQQPYEWTIIGEGAGAEIKVGPLSNATANSYLLMYERERGFYPSTTLNVPTTTLPQATLTVQSTSAAASAGSVLIAGRPVAYTGKTGSTLTGCTGGTGTFAQGEIVVYLQPQAGELSEDSDTPLLPPETHQILVHAAQAIGQTGENDYSVYMSDDRVQQALEQMRRRYLPPERGGVEQWGSYLSATVETGGGW
jgi:hypothetical protein